MHFLILWWTHFSELTRSSTALSYRIQSLCRSFSVLMFLCHWERCKYLAPKHLTLRPQTQPLQRTQYDVSNNQYISRFWVTLHLSRRQWEWRSNSFLICPHFFLEIFPEGRQFYSVLSRAGGKKTNKKTELLQKEYASSGKLMIRKLIWETQRLISPLISQKKVTILLLSLDLSAEKDNSHGQGNNTRHLLQQIFHPSKRWILKLWLVFL